MLPACCCLQEPTSSPGLGYGALFSASRGGTFRGMGDLADPLSPGVGYGLGGGGGSGGGGAGGGLGGVASAGGLGPWLGGGPAQGSGLRPNPAPVVSQYSDVYVAFCTLFAVLSGACARLVGGAVGLVDEREYVCTCLRSPPPIGPMQTRQ